MFKREHVELARRLTQMGSGISQIAEAFGVTETTVYEWMQRHPEFANAITATRHIADEKVAAALYSKAVGFKREAVKAMQHNGNVVLAKYEEQLPPDTAAAFIWLKNRQPELWKDRHEITGADGKPIEVALSWVNGRQVVDAQDIEPNSPGLLASNHEDVKPEDPMLAGVSKT
jgi:transcriptional regulator with XRE-family HTH domain